MVDKTDLRACPFCGGENVKTFGPYGWNHAWAISHSCASFYSGAQEMFQGFPSEAAATEAWNTRTDSDLVKALVEALEECLDAVEDQLWPQNSAVIEKARAALLLANEGKTR